MQPLVIYQAHADNSARVVQADHATRELRSTGGPIDRFCLFEIRDAGDGIVMLYSVGCDSLVFAQGEEHRLIAQRQQHEDLNWGKFRIYSHGYKNVYFESIASTANKIVTSHAEVKRLMLSQPHPIEPWSSFSVFTFWEHAMT
jgi:hypothetical protein